ncbi:MAG: AmmeMemoRadiSam system radical SAM enzyme [Planctomycetes bacterium]|nr:AmmeMemoRadiSam system radical SAM enzyme [Planctomycetota bacterium]
MAIEARWYESLPDGRTRCLLCPRGCVRSDGEAGYCLGRVTHGGKLWAETYGRPASIALDPIEKKPLYHFYPGSNILSIGTYGCNLGCTFCQNWLLSQQVTPTEELTCEELVDLAQKQDCIGVAYTYNEPIIWLEYVQDSARLMQAAGFKTVMVTNGMISEEPLREILPLIDAMNIDLKAFREDFYQELCGGSLAPILRTCEIASQSCHVEVTNLVIPGYNDNPGEQEEMAAWIAEKLGETTPVHLSAYSPRHRLQAYPTSLDDLLAARERFIKHLKYVYLGNVQSPEGNNTICPQCGAEVIKRVVFAVNTSGLNSTGGCAACGADCHIITG